MSGDVQGNERTGTSSGRGFAITGLVFAFIIPIVGLILGLVARQRAQRSGSTGVLPTVTIIVSAVLIVVELVIGAIVWGQLFATSR